MIERVDDRRFASGLDRASGGIGVESK